jgi:colanic acid/amylovoran biosynthesis protein
VVVSGRGGTADAFRDDGLRLLEMLRLAGDLGATTAMVGQGLGPAEDRELLARAADVLPRVDLIAVRDRVTSLALLERAGVDPDRVVVTGDDALAAAYALRPEAARAGGLGVGLRVADYSELGDDVVERVRRALGEAAERHGTELHAVPISLYPHEADADAIAALGGESGTEVETPRAAIERAGACRVVVTGSYHAAVFALAQGVPVVGLASSAYYSAKLNGIAELFPGGCTVVPLSGDGLEQRIAAAIDASWAGAESVRPDLLAAAQRQIAAAEGAYERLAAALTGSPPVGSQYASNGSTPGSATWREPPVVSAAN